MSEINPEESVTLKWSEWARARRRALEESGVRSDVIDEQEINPEEPAILRLSEWFVMLDALEEWSYRNDMAGAEARMIRAKFPKRAIDEWERNKDTPPPAPPLT